MVKVKGLLSATAAAAVTARKDDAAAADQAATAKLAVSVSSAWDGGLIQTTSQCEHSPDVVAQFLLARVN